MNDKALTRISSASKLLKVQNGSLIQSTEFVAAIRLACALQDELDEFWSDVKGFMEENDITESKGDVTLKLTPARNLRADLSVVKPRFLKQAPDTTTIRAWQHLHGGELPTGVSETISNRLTKKVNA